MTNCTCVKEKILAVTGACVVILGSPPCSRSRPTSRCATPSNRNVLVHDLKVGRDLFRGAFEGYLPATRRSPLRKHLLGRSPPCSRSRPTSRCATPSNQRHRCDLKAGKGSVPRLTSSDTIEPRQRHDDHVVANRVTPSMPRSRPTSRCATPSNHVVLVCDLKVGRGSSRGSMDRLATPRQQRRPFMARSHSPFPLLSSYR